MMLREASIRMFIAAQLPQAFLPVLGEASDVVRQNAHSLRLTKPENLHLTLCFLGDLPQDKAREVRDWFGGLPVLLEEERMAHIADYGAFRGRDGLTLWAGLTVTERMKALALELADGARALDIAVDHRAFVPHVTLARSARLTRPIQEIAPGLPRSAPAAFPAVVLFQSTFAKSGMLYTPLHLLE